MQSNKSSKERDGAQKDKQIAFLQNSFSRDSFFSKRQSERSRDTVTDEQKEIRQGLKMLHTFSQVLSKFIYRKGLH